MKSRSRVTQPSENSKVESTMDFDSALTEVGEFGRFQQKNFFLVNVLGFPLNAQMLLLVFVAAKPEWSCMDSGQKCSTAEGTICNNARFVSNFTSIVSEWGLVCDQAYKVETVQSMFMFGTLFGAPLLGNLADKYGRKPIYVIAYISTCVSCLFSAMATSYNMFVALRFITGFFNGGGGLILFVISTETVGAKYRGLVGTAQNGFFSVYLMIVGWLAYMIPNWRYLTMVTVIPAIIQIPLFSYIPESARWLASQGRYSEAEALLQEAASMNHPYLKSRPLVLKRHQGNAGDSSSAGGVSFLSLFTHRQTCKRMLNICLLFFVNSLVYYGLSLNLKNLGGNLYVNFALAGLVELPSLIACAFLLQHLGRRRTLFILMMGAAISCFVCMRFQVSHHSSPHLISASAMVGKFFINASFSVAYVYGSELLPTVVRNVGLGVACVANRCGGISSPFVVLFGETNKSLPMLTFSICAFIAGVVGAALPETHGKPLPETFDDIEHPHKPLPMKTFHPTKT